VTTPAPIELYFWPTPNGWKISIALEELALPYVLRPINLIRAEQFQPDFLRVNPNGKIPAIVDPHGPGQQPISVFESGAILQYLGRKCGHLYPADERARVAVDEWLAWQVAGLGPMTGQYGHFSRFAPEKIAYAIERYATEMRRLYGVMEQRLEGRDYLADEYSIADIACWPWVQSAQQFGFDLAAFPRLLAWLERIGARPAVQRGSRVGLDLRGPPPPR
jgi:GSH-dependent disulfide-bond oxidoreductase